MPVYLGLSSDYHLFRSDKLLLLFSSQGRHKLYQYGYGVEMVAEVKKKYSLYPN